MWLYSECEMPKLSFRTMKVDSQAPKQLLSTANLHLDFYPHRGVLLSV
jgi:hypothetical protein